MDQSATIAVVKEYIRHLRENKFAIQKAYLFGSYATGKQHDDSDIDLALIMNGISNTFVTQVELMKISRKFDTRIEPHPFREADFNMTNPFANEILQKGIQIA
ncbi:MAG: nucleotidyltransferase domain-containing protein [Anaerolineales bacterium]|nr:nucleotidyltransferase domain-containing protein [Anaerolineales bacterium]